MRLPKDKYIHSLANYPTNFKYTLRTKNKICVQFEYVDTKLRVGWKDDKPIEDGVFWKDGRRHMIIDSHETPVKTLAVGLYIPVFLDTLRAMKISLKEYIKEFGEHHTEEEINKMLETLHF